jgi:prepilin-type N-terminal cleavage/methylation domain-containing protein
VEAEPSNAIREQLSVFCGIMPMILLAFAGIAKAADISAFAQSLSTWDIVPRKMIPSLALGIPTLEISLALFFAMKIRRRLVCIVAAFLVTLFAGAYIVHLIWYSVPDCNCFGKLSLLHSRSAEAPWTISINAVMFVMLLVSAYLDPGSRGKRPINPRPTHAGFTLIETLLVLVLISLLVALILPTLGVTKRRAARIASHANLHSHVSVLGIYAAEWKDSLPFFTDPTASYTVLSGGGERVLARFFDARFRWPWGLADAYYNGNIRSKSFFIPGLNEYGPRTYSYPSVCITRPEFWDLTMRTGPQQFRPARLDEVLYPSQKGVFVGNPGAMQGFETGNVFLDIGCADGSAHSELRNEILPWVNSGEGQWYAPPEPFGRPVEHTENGVRGRDLK